MMRFFMLTVVSILSTNAQKTPEVVYEYAKNYQYEGGGLESQTFHKTPALPKTQTYVVEKEFVSKDIFDHKIVLDKDINGSSQQRILGDVLDIMGTSPSKEGIG